MGAYHQLGFNSENLILKNEDLKGYCGAILSPVNYSETDSKAQIARCRYMLDRDFETILDPQLYVPYVGRGELGTWSYFPKDVETADMGDLNWWAGVNTSLARCFSQINAHALCSPINYPKGFPNEFYHHSVAICDDLCRKLGGAEKVILTAIVAFDDLSLDRRASMIASILTKSEASRVYLNFASSLEPRREFSDSASIAGAMGLIDALEGAGMRVLVGNTSTDMVLWKAAGARDVATGKFFNLRRFTHSRFADPAEADSGGQQIPYWIEDSLLAFLREPDLLQLRAEGLLGPVTEKVPTGQAILEHLDDQSKKLWIAMAWHHYLAWFEGTERRIQAGLDVAKWLESAEDAWLTLEDKGILFVEPRNKGSWLRPWRIALNAYRKNRR